MSDAQDAAWRLRQRRHADQTRRRLTRIFDADGDGLSDSTLPMFGQRSGGRQGPPPSPISLPVGETVTVESVARNGDDLIWTEHPGPVAAGRPQTFPTTALETRTGGYYVLHLEKLDLVSLGGATVTVTTSSGLVRVAAAPSFGRHLRGAEVPLGTLPRGTIVTVSCDQPIVLAVATLEHKDTGALVVNDPAPSLPDGVIGWWMADAITGVADGGTVNTWPDSGPNGYDLTYFTGGNDFGSGPPRLTVPGKNGLPVVNFGAASDRWSIGGLLGASTGTTWSNIDATFYVLKNTRNLGANTRQYVNARDPGDSAHARITWQTNWDGTPSQGRMQMRSIPGLTVPSAWVTGWSVFHHQNNPHRFWRDGTLLASDSSTDKTSLGSIRFGDNPASVSGMAVDAEFAEVILFEGNHDADQRATVLAYLADKWGL